MTREPLEEFASSILSMGYEVVLRAGEKQYRYVAVGGLGYYCGEM